MRVIVHVVRSYGVFPLLKDMLQGILDFKIDNIGVCKGCALNKHANISLSNDEHKLIGFLCMIHLDVCDPMSTTPFLGNIYHV